MRTKRNDCKGYVLLRKCRRVSFASKMALLQPNNHACGMHGFSYAVLLFQRFFYASQVRAAEAEELPLNAGEEDADNLYEARAQFSQA